MDAREIATLQEITVGIMVEKLNHCEDGKEGGEPSPQIGQHNEKKALHITSLIVRALMRT